MEKVRWGVLSTAKIGRQKVIPAMQQGRHTEVAAIASRDRARAEEVSASLGVPRAYGSYEELLADPDIDAVYIPLPNHLHVPWSRKALEAGKHVLCEKPIGLSSAEARELVEASRQHPHLKVMEAFMYRFHPQWHRAKELVDEGAIGRLRSIHSSFAYFNDDPENIRNQAEMGGGSLMDIGCYCVSLSRFLFDDEPERVVSDIEWDPDFETDRLTSGLLDFTEGTSTFTCATQMVRHQRVMVVGTERQIEIEKPFNPAPDEPSRLWLSSKEEREEIVFKPCNQYTIQGDLFSRAILDDSNVPTPLDDAVKNMEVIEAVVESAERGTWAAR